MNTIIFSLNPISQSSNNNNTNNNTNNTSNNISQNPASVKKYWCHLCKKSFLHIYDETTDVQCMYCNKTFCELLQTDNILDQSHPINFTPYVVNGTNAESNTNSINNNNNSNNNNINNILEDIEENGNNANNDNGRRNVRRHFSGLLFNFIGADNPFRLLSPIIRNHFIQNYEDNIDNIISEIMLHDTNKYGNPPAAKNAIEKLEKCKISEKIMKEFGVENSCAVCKDEFIIGEECLLMPCNHHFHENCLLPWLKERNSCPVCRYELPTDDEDFELRKKQKLINNNNISNNNEDIHG